MAKPDGKSKARVNVSRLNGGQSRLAILFGTSTFAGMSFLLHLPGSWGNWEALLKAGLTATFVACLVYGLAHCWLCLATAHDDLMLAQRALPVGPPTLALAKKAVESGDEFALALGEFLRHNEIELDVAAVDVAVRKATRQWYERACRPRSFAGNAVYVGLAGTLLGLTVAVTSLSNLAGDSAELRGQILGVIGGFSGSFYCALAGVVATVVTSRLLSGYDAAVDQYDHLVEDYLSGSLLPRIKSELDAKRRREHKEEVTQLAEAVRTAIREGVSDVAKEMRVGNEILQTMVNESKTNGDETRKCIDELADMVSQVREDHEQIVEATTLLETTAQRVEKGSEGLGLVQPVLDAIKAGMESIKPMLAGATDIRAGLEGLNQFPAAAEGIVHRMASKLLEHEVRIVEHFGHQSDTINEIAKSIHQEVGLLASAVSDYSEYVRDLPLSTSGERIVQEMNGSVASMRKVADTETEEMKKLRTQFEGFDARVNAFLAQLKAASEDARKEMENTTHAHARTQQSMSSIEERLREPLWKRMRGG